MSDRQQARCSRDSREACRLSERRDGEASRAAYLLLLSLMAALCCLPSLPPGSPLLGQLQTLVGSEVSEPDHLSRWVWHPQDLPTCADPLEDHITWHQGPWSHRWVWKAGRLGLACLQQAGTLRHMVLNEKDLSEISGHPHMCR